MRGNTSRRASCAAALAVAAALCGGALLGGCGAILAAGCAVASPAAALSALVRFAAESGFGQGQPQASAAGGAGRGELAQSASPDAEPTNAPTDTPGPADGRSVDALLAPYLKPLLTEAERPENAGVVVEKTYGQGSGEAYIPCGAGSIKNNTRVSAAEVAADIQNGLPFAVEPNSALPQVLILHTHATETYRLSEGLWFSPTDTARSTDQTVDMCAVGCAMADTLNAAGIHTLHDQSLNDYPSYTGSYANSRAVAQRYLEQYPSIKVVLDVHRDAIETEAGSRVAPVCTVNGRKAAQVMLICGCNNGTSVKIPDYLENLRFAAAWERVMEADYPTFTRPVLFSYRFYNQDLSTGALLIEIGGHGSSLNDALYAGVLAAKALAKLLVEGG